jgi:predicted amidohydrolase
MSPARNQQKYIGKVRAAVESVAADSKMNPFSRLTESLCSAAVVDDEDYTPIKRPKEIRIALVSMPAWPYQLYDYDLAPKYVPAGIDRKDFKRTLAWFTKPARQMRAFEEALQTALVELRANIVCVSELGLPASNLIPMDEALETAHRMSNRHNALIVAGTSHDARTHHNTGYLFHPGGPRTGWGFHKSFSAVSMEERITAPSERHVSVIETLGLRIATMICLDIADYASLASVMHVGDHVDVLLVPCFTKRFEKMLDIARLASSALPGVVALVNAKLSDSDAGPRHIARFGKLLEPSDVKRLPGGAEVALITFKQKQFQEQRTRKKTNPSRYIDWLFGNRDRPRIHAHPRRT